MLWHTTLLYHTALFHVFDRPLMTDECLQKQRSSAGRVTYREIGRDELDIERSARRKTGPSFRVVPEGGRRAGRAACLVGGRH